MERLLIIADDFTGALDTGIQFADYGARTEIMTDADVDFAEYPTAEVIIVDTETRHLHGTEAYDIVFNLTQRAVNSGITCLYKKTDSGLRGNIAEEVRAVLDASGQGFIAFLPAFPQMNRIVKDGISYVDGIPISESVFAHDPFEPVTCSRVKDFFGDYKELVKEYRKPEELDIDTEKKQIAIFDASTDLELNKIAEILQKKEKLKVLAGCAGFAAAIPKYLSIPRRVMNVHTVKKPLLIVCGSINDISKKQISFAKDSGYTGVTLTMEQQLKEDYLLTAEGRHLVSDIVEICLWEGVCVVDTQSNMQGVNKYLEKKGISLEKARVRIADRISELLEGVIDNGLEATIMVIGGDTLFHFIRKMKCRQITLLCELEKGVVYSDMKIKGEHYKVISKSGGFGDVDLLVKLINLTDGCCREGSVEDDNAILFEDARESLLR